MGDEIKVDILENFTQSLVDSGHKFLFVKPIILQALTRYKYMQERDKLKLEDPRYKKLYRNKMDDFEERVKLKAVEKFSWYTDGSLKDPWRDYWKFLVRRWGKNVNKTKGHRLSLNQKPLQCKQIIPPQPLICLYLLQMEVYY